MFGPLSSLANVGRLECLVATSSITTTLVFVVFVVLDMTYPELLHAANR